MTIEIIRPTPASIDGATIHAALDAQHIATAHGETFTGRPMTKIIASDDYVIKLREDYRLNRTNAIRFIQNAIQLEQTLGVHHPGKTWFIHQTSAIANITPRLQPLHEPGLLDTFQADSFVVLLENILERYFAIAVEHDLRLDLGLSNFAIDRDSHTYYLDDETYSWDNFLSLSHFLGVLVRSQHWLTPEHAGDLGKFIRQQVTDRFGDSHHTTVIVGHLNCVFIPPQKKPVMDAMIRALQRGEYIAAPRPAHIKQERIALIADIHANAPALRAALDYIDDSGVDSTLVLGDIVGYGPHPRQCIELLRSAPRCSILRGNHDHAAARGQTNANMQSFAKWALQWTIEQLTEDDKTWLAELPLFLEGDTWLALHGAPLDKSYFNAYVYKMTYGDNLDNLAERNIKLCFHGHTHIQTTYYRNTSGDGQDLAPNQDLSKHHHALVCPGSIGQPRNGERGAQLAILDLSRQHLQFHSIQYNLESTITDMRAADFPATLIDRLARGE